MPWMDQVREFSKEVRVEFGKVSWPTRTELRDSTVVVIVTMILITVFIGVVDHALNLVMGMVLR